MRLLDSHILFLVIEHSGLNKLDLAMIDLTIAFSLLVGGFILLPSVWSFRAKDQHSLSLNPNELSDLARVPSQGGAPARVVNLLSYTH